MCHPERKRGTSPKVAGHTRLFERPSLTREVPHQTAFGVPDDRQGVGLRWGHLRLLGPSFAFGIKRVVNNKLALKNLMIRQPECPKATRDPTQTFTSRMRIGWMRISRADNFAQKQQRRRTQVVFLKNGIE